jgi:hypothetical protein
MKHKGTTALFRYWDRLRGDRPAPRRTEIEPAEIKSLLADTFILEKDARGEAIFRLAGTRLCATYGRELKGYAFPLLWSRRDQRIVSRHAYSVFHYDAVVAITFEGRTEGGKAAPFEMVMLPLSGDKGSPRALGCIVPAQKPYWLGADPVAENRIESLRIVDPVRERVLLAGLPRIDGPPLAPDRLAPDQLAPDQLDGATDGGRRIRHLVVFDGGRED